MIESAAHLIAVDYSWASICVLIETGLVLGKRFMTDLDALFA
jgi:hypothetical protein